MKRKYIPPFSRLNLPELFSTEVVVCGGGPAGVAAALSAARTGATVVLLEQCICCGGMSTAGLVPAFIHFSDRKNPVASGVPMEIVEEMCSEMKIEKVNMIWQNIDPEILKRVYDRLLEKAGVKVCFGTRIADVCKSGRCIESVLVSTADGLQRVSGKVFIDCTGDGTIAFLAGNDCEIGDEDGNLMGPTLCVQYSGINSSRLRSSGGNGESAIELWKKHKDEFCPWESHFVGLSEHGNNSASGNLGHIYETDPLNVFSYSRACSEGRKIAEAIHRFYVKYVPGCEQADLVSSADLLGVRESRRITGDYTLTIRDYMNKQHFPDEIGLFFYPVDIHSSCAKASAHDEIATKMKQTATVYAPGENYGIPYRTLIAADLENLLIAGRCISCDRAMQASIRVMPCCMITGRAAGVAAALSISEHCNIHTLEIKKLRAVLKTQGAWLLESVEKEN